MNELVVIGAGGHAKVILDMIEEATDFEVIGCIARHSPDPAHLTVPVLGDETHLPHLLAAGIRKAFVAVGDNRARSRLFRSARELGFELVNIVSRHAIVSRRAELCTGVAVMPGAIINAYARLGHGCIINTGTTVDHDCVVASWAHLAPQTGLAGHVRIGEGALLGIGVKVIPNISIGAWTTIGAGAVVIRNIPEGVRAVGVPARIVRETLT